MWNFWCLYRNLTTSYLRKVLCLKHSYKIHPYIHTNSFPNSLCKSLIDFMYQLSQFFQAVSLIDKTDPSSMLEI